MSASEAWPTLPEEELLRALARLPRRGPALRRAGRDAADAATWQVAPRPGELGKVPGTIDDSVVAALAGRGWLEGHGDARTLAAAGLAALRRWRSGGGPVSAPAAASAPLPAKQSAADRTPEINDAESPLGWLRRRKDKNGRPILSAAQFDAGERLRADFELGQIGPRVTSSWSGLASSRRTPRAVPGFGMEPADRVVAARQRVGRALRAVGAEHAGILIDVCCFLKGLEEVERERNDPQRSAKVVLLMALSALARHYGLVRQDEGLSPAHRAILHWGSEDYRPGLGAWQDESARAAAPSA